jgi:hypothetical protein
MTDVALKTLPRQCVVILKHLIGVPDLILPIRFILGALN